MKENIIEINDLVTIKQLSNKYNIPYGTLYKAIVMNLTKLRKKINMTADCQSASGHIFTA